MLTQTNDSNPHLMSIESLDVGHVANVPDLQSAVRGCCVKVVCPSFLERKSVDCVQMAFELGQETTCRWLPHSQHAVFATAG